MKTLNYYQVEVAFVANSENCFKRTFAFKHKSSATSFSRNLFSRYLYGLDGSSSIEVDGKPCQVLYASVDFKSVTFLDSLL